VVLVESFFILLLVMGGVRAIQIFLLWPAAAGVCAVAEHHR
jgi:hypothetical protein